MNASDLSIPLPSPAETTVMNWKLYTHFHGNKPHCPTAIPPDLCNGRFPIKSSPREVAERTQTQQAAAHRASEAGAGRGFRRRKSGRQSKGDELNGFLSDCFLPCEVYP